MMPLDRSDYQNIFKYTVIFLGAWGVFKLLTPKPRKSLILGKLEVKEAEAEEREFITPPPVLSEEEANSYPKQIADAHVALGTYIDGYNKGLPTAELENGINKELSNDMGLKVYRRGSDGKIVVKDLNGRDVIEYDAVAAAAQTNS